MKNKFFTVLAALSFMAFTACSDDDSQSTNNGVNDGTPKKYIESVVFTSNDNSENNRNLSVTYDNDGKVTNVSVNEDTAVLSYEGENLTNITGGGDEIIMSDVMSTVYDGYEVGEVLNYDNDGNPVEIRLFERGWEGAIEASYVATVTYDNKPNPYYYTMEAAGVIDILDNVELNFSMTPQAEEIVLAKMLLPVNNPSKVVVRDEETQEVVSEITAIYQYNSNDYPTTVSITEVNADNYVYTYNAVYTYKE